VPLQDSLAYFRDVIMATLRSVAMPLMIYQTQEMKMKEPAGSNPPAL
jgi:hypothetical protein